MQTDGSPLSEREKEVARILLRGKGNKQIALELGISTRTVEFHLRNIYAKLGVASRTEAVLKLAEGHLWETPGEDRSEEQGKTTVDGPGDSTENEDKSISRRIPVKKTYILAGTFLAICLLGGLLILNFPLSRGKSALPTPGGQLADVTATLATQPVTSSPQTSSVTLSVPTESSPPEGITFSPHTVNGYTAAIESYYIDSASLIFQVRITGEGINFGSPDFYGRIRVINLYDENGNLINSSGGSGPALDPELIQIEFHPLTHLVGDRLKGQFAFDLLKTSAGEEPLAQFRFDFDLPLHAPRIYHPRQAVTASGLEILLDQVTVTPNSTLAYLCFPPPSFADWQIGRQSVLSIEGQEATPFIFTVPFDSALGGDRRAGYEPYWAPSVKNGRCVKSTFPIGDSNAATLVLTIPQLEKIAPNVLLTDLLIKNYPDLLPGDAYYKYLEEHGNTYKGPWTFDVKLTP